MAKEAPISHDFSNLVCTMHVNLLTREKQISMKKILKSCRLSSGNGQVFIYILLQGKRGRKKSMSESGSAKKKYKKRGRKHSPEKKTKVGVQRKFF